MIHCFQRSMCQFGAFSLHSRNAAAGAGGGCARRYTDLSPSRSDSVEPTICFTAPCERSNRCRWRNSKQWHQAGRRYMHMQGLHAEKHLVDVNAGAELCASTGAANKPAAARSRRSGRRCEARLLGAMDPQDHQMGDWSAMISCADTPLTAKCSRPPVQHDGASASELQSR